MTATCYATSNRHGRQQCIMMIHACPPVCVCRGTSGPLAGGAAHPISTHWLPGSHKQQQGPLPPFPFDLPEPFDSALQQQYSVVTDLRNRIRNSGLDDSRRNQLQAVIQSYFREWLHSSGAIRQVIAAITLSWGLQMRTVVCSNSSDQAGKLVVSCDRDGSSSVKSAAVITPGTTVLHIPGQGPSHSPGGLQATLNLSGPVSHLFSDPCPVYMLHLPLLLPQVYDLSKLEGDEYGPLNGSPPAGTFLRDHSQL